ncbi:DUF4920 domain-containing protein [Winogradskyella maritima]|uniref:DUF4920 domain-containing protein n=1 Tax=Winogradskyella maritima TaxID=1517766 RepID=A0ABV8AN47_9FLAO|nr:DUF4920 domain-containing protein [Winogradskyella maritima]
MKKILILSFALALCFACKDENKDDQLSTDVDQSEEIAQVEYTKIGMEISANDALASDRMLTHYAGLSVGDTINAKMKGEIKEVCAKKGCWMIMDIGNGETARVTFKDYGFFMPLDASGEVIVNGKAFVSETSVADLKHYAEDAGKSKEEIDAITAPEKTYAFEADGVLLKK